eukprot:1122803-Pyramimonas_sp.AAC.1
MPSFTLQCLFGRDYEVLWIKNAYARVMTAIKFPKHAHLYLRQLGIDQTPGLPPSERSVAEDLVGAQARPLPCRLIPLRPPALRILF